MIINQREPESGLRALIDVAMVWASLAPAWLPSGTTHWRKLPAEGRALSNPGVGYVVIERV
jgi:hypothetical protein